MQSFALRFKAMGGINEIQLYAQNQHDAHEIGQQIFTEVNRLEQKYSRFQSDSTLSAMNDGASRGGVEVDAETASLLNFAQACFEDTGGLFDVTSGALQKIWKFRTPDLPSSVEIKKALVHVGWRKVEWRSPFLRFDTPHMQIDLGGLVKEYAVDQARNLLVYNGFRSALLNFAGDIFAVGPRPDGRPWVVGITDPRNVIQPIDRVALFEGALATSGDYERFKIVDGKRYCHIINPITGYPVTGIQSVSTLADRCMIAGALSTAAMLNSPSNASSFLKRSGVRFLILTDSGVYEDRWPGSQNIRRQNRFFSHAREAH